MANPYLKNKNPYSRPKNMKAEGILEKAITSSRGMAFPVAPWNAIPINRQEVQDIPKGLASGFNPLNALAGESAGMGIPPLGIARLMGAGKAIDKPLQAFNKAIAPKTEYGKGIENTAIMAQAAPMIGGLPGLLKKGGKGLMEIFNVESDSISNSIGYLVNAMDTNPEGFRKSALTATMRFGGEKPGNIMGISTTGPLWGAFSKEGQDLEAQRIKQALTNMHNRVVRLQSGAQINMQEFSRIVEQLPTWEDFYNPQDTNFEIAKRKLANFAEEMNDIKSRVVGGRAVDDNGRPIQYDPNQWEEEINKYIVSPVSSEFNTSPTPTPGVGETPVTQGTKMSPEEIKQHRAWALEAIHAGESEASVAAQFKNETGEDW